MAKLKINGKHVDIDVDESTPLLWVLREQLGLTGTKYGCGIGRCGACTVHLNGEAVRSCQIPVSAIDAAQEIVTIEGLSADGSHPLQKAWLELDVPQCGYCQSGMIMSAAALLNSNPDPSDADIDASITNICRCGTFNRVRRGIHLAAQNNMDVKKGGKSSRNNESIFHAVIALSAPPLTVPGFVLACICPCAVAMPWLLQDLQQRTLQRYQRLTPGW